MYARLRIPISFSKKQLDKKINNNSNRIQALLKTDYKTVIPLLIEGFYSYFT